DGIRYWSVTGVQTCALPISSKVMPWYTIRSCMQGAPWGGLLLGCNSRPLFLGALAPWREAPEKNYLSPRCKGAKKTPSTRMSTRSEERRVGKEGRAQRSTYD